MVDKFLVSGTNNQPATGVSAGDVAMFNAGPFATDYGPVVDPFANINDVYFHSDFEYLRGEDPVLSSDPGMSTVSVPANTTNTVYNVTTTLFAHGKAFTPLLIGQITAGATPLTQMLNGMVVLRGDSGRSFMYVHVFADATNVYMRVQGWFIDIAQTINWKIYVLEEAFQVVKPRQNNVRFDGTGVQSSGIDVISTDYRYLRDSQTDIWLSEGQTIDIRVNTIQIAGGGLIPVTPDFQIAFDDGKVTYLILSDLVATLTTVATPQSAVTGNSPAFTFTPATPFTDCGH